MKTNLLVSKNQVAANENEDPIKLRDALRTYAPVVDRVLARLLRTLPRCVDEQDLRAAGMAALLVALRRSVHTTEDMFVAYAQIRIRGAIMDELRRIDWSPRRRKPTEGKPNASPASVLRIVAIGEMEDGDGSYRQATVLESPLDAIIRRRESVDLRNAVRSLPPREAEVVRLRYFEEMPSKEIAAALRVSEARVSQINASATRKLRALLADRHERDAFAA